MRWESCQAPMGGTGTMMIRVHPTGIVPRLGQDGVKASREGTGQGPLGGRARERPVDGAGEIIRNPGVQVGGMNAKLVEAPPLGRREILGELQGSIQRTRNGEGSLLVLAGRVGVGKASLLEEALEALQVPEEEVTRVRLEPSDEARPFHAISPLLIRAVGATRYRVHQVQSSLFLSPLVPDSQGALEPVGAEVRAPERARGENVPDLHEGRSRPPSEEPSDAHERLLKDLEFYKRGVEAWGDRSRFIHEVGEAIHLLAKSHDVIWIVENAQHLDPHSHAVLRYLVDRLADSRLGIWLTLDQEEEDEVPEPLRILLESPQARLLWVPPLSQEEMAAFLPRIVPPEHLTPQLVEEVYEASGGLPMLVEQMLKDRDWRQPLTRPLPQGRSTEAILLGRIRRLDPVSRRHLEELSVLGIEFDFELALSMLATPEEEAAEILEGLVRKGFLRELEGERYSFVLETLPSILESGLPPGGKERVHARAASALEKGSRVEPDLRTYRVAEQWLRARDWPRAAEANRLAASTALDRYAPDLALKYAEDAWTAARSLAPSDPAVEGTILTEKGRALHDLQRLHEAEEVLRQALERIPRDRAHWPARSRALFHLARTLGAMGRAQEALPLTQEAARGFELEGDARGQLMLHQVVGVSLMMVGKNKEAAEHFREQLRLANTLREEREVAYAKKNLSAVLLAEDPRDPEGEQLVEEALRYHARTHNYAGLAAGHLNRGLNHLARNEPERALEEFRRSREAGEKARAPLLVGSSSVEEARLCLESGKVEEAERALQVLEPFAPALEDPYTRIHFPALEGEVAETRGDLVRARDFYGKALEEARRAGAPPDVWESTLRVARVLRRLGDGPEAARLRATLPPLPEIEAKDPSLAARVRAYDSGPEGTPGDPPAPGGSG